MIDETKMDLKALSKWLIPSFGWVGKTCFLMISTITIGVALLHNFLLSRVARQGSKPFNIMIAIDSAERLIGALCMEFKLASMIWKFSIEDLLGTDGCW